MPLRNKPTDPARGLGTVQMFTFGFGTIVGIAWVVLMGQLLAQAGLAGALLGLTLGAVLMMAIGLCYAEMGARFPLAGGEIAYAREVYGVGVSHLVGWFLLLSCILVCGFEMVSVGWLVTQLWPQAAHTRMYAFLGENVYLEPLLASCAIQLLIAAANHRGAERAGQLQTITTISKLLLSMAFIVAGLCAANPTNSQPLFVHDEKGSILPGVISVITIAPFWFSGFNAISQTLGERSGGTSAAGAARLILVSLVAAWAFYCLVLVSMTLVLPRQSLLSHSLPTAAAFQAAFHSPAIGNAVLFAALLGLISTWNALFFSATRVLFVLAQDGFVSALFRTTHPRFFTPTAAIVAIALVIPVCALLGKAVIGPLLSLFSVVMAGIYATVCLGVIRLRRSQSWLPGLALASCFVIAAFASLEPLRNWNNGRWPFEWLLLLVWTGCGIGLGRRLHRKVAP
jgi:amino acid transporter